YNYIFIFSLLDALPIYLIIKNLDLTVCNLANSVKGRNSLDLTVGDLSDLVPQNLNLAIRNLANGVECRDSLNLPVGNLSNLVVKDRKSTRLNYSYVKI